MSLTKSQIQSWRPAALVDIGQTWSKTGLRIEGLFDQYRSAVATVHGGHWQGLTADAALARADSDRRAAVRLVDHLERVAGIAAQGFHAIDPPLRRAREAIDDAERRGYTVSENLFVTKSRITEAETRVAAQLWAAIDDAASDAEKADDNATRALADTRQQLQGAFVAPGSLGSEQAKTDAEQLARDPSQLTGAQMQRLLEAGSLTPEQLTAMQTDGNVNIPASQMEYLNALARSLDGKSPQDIEAMLNKVSPRARTGAANTLQLLSSAKVTASLQGDVEIPTRGGTELLPQQMYRSLTRPDLVNGYNFKPGSVPTTPEAGHSRIELNGVADNEAIARIAHMSDPALKHNTGLDRAVMDTAQTYLHAQVVAQHNDALLAVDEKVYAGGGDGVAVTEQMFAAVSDDRAVVADAVTGTDGESLLSDIFKNEWSDDGRAASELFNISADDAVPELGNRPDELRAEESAEIANAAAHYMSDHAGELLKLADDNTTSVGELNPHLINTLADKLAPYYSSLAGAHLVSGIEPMDNDVNRLADMYAVLATDSHAGVLAANHTAEQAAQLAFAHGASPADFNPEFGEVAGYMHHALERGTADAWQQLDKHDTAEAQRDAGDDVVRNNTIGKVGTTALDWFAPGPVKTAVELAMPSLQSGLIGVPDYSAMVDPHNPDAHDTAVKLANSNVTLENLANGLLARRPSLPEENPDWAPYVRTDELGNRYVQIDDFSPEDPRQPWLESDRDERQRLIYLLGEHDVFAEPWLNAFERGHGAGSLRDDW